MNCFQRHYLHPREFLLTTEEKAASATRNRGINTCRNPVFCCCCCSRAVNVSHPPYPLLLSLLGTIYYKRSARNRSKSLPVSFRSTDAFCVLLGLAINIIRIILLSLCVICVSPCQQLVCHLSSEGGLEIFKVRNDFSGCCAHKGETGIGESAQAGVDSGELKKPYFALSRSGVDPAVASFAG